MHMISGHLRATVAVIHGNKTAKLNKFENKFENQMHFNIHVSGIRGTPRT